MLSLPDKYEVFPRFGVLTIDSYHVGLVKQWGEFTGTILEPGLRWVVPVAESVVIVSLMLRRYNPPVARFFIGDAYLDVNLTFFYYVVDPIHAGLRVEGTISNAIAGILRGIQEEVIRQHDIKTLTSSPIGVRLLIDAMMAANDKIVAVTGASLYDVRVEQLEPQAEVARAFSARLIAEKEVEAWEARLHGIAKILRDIPPELRPYVMNVLAQEGFNTAAAGGQLIVAGLPGNTQPLPEHILALAARRVNTYEPE